jgi:hypothetical protein
LPPDARGGVRFFSVLLILGGVACGALFVLILAVALFVPPGAAGTMNARMVIPSSAVYILIGAALVTLGVGSWKLRRWARPLILTFGWSLLVVGVMSVVFLALLLPRLLEPYQTPGSAPVMGCVVAMTVGMVALLLAFPIALVVFYGRPRVRALFDRDTRTYWTDRTPPVLLGIAVLLWIGALATLGALGYPALPFFGRMFTGWSLRVLVLALAGVCAWLGWAVYRRQPAGFWGLVAVQVFSLVNIFTMRGLDPATMFRGMGYSEAEISQMSQFRMFDDPVFLGMMAVCWLLLTVALFAIRKHFLPASARQSAAPPPV